MWSVQLPSCPGEGAKATSGGDASKTVAPIAAVVVALLIGVALLVARKRGQHRPRTQRYAVDVEEVPIHATNPSFNTIRDMLNSPRATPTLVKTSDRTDFDAVCDHLASIGESSSDDVTDGGAAQGPSMVVVAAVVPDYERAAAGDASLPDYERAGSSAAILVGDVVYNVATDEVDAYTVIGNDEDGPSDGATHNTVNDNGVAPVVNPVYDVGNAPDPDTGATLAFLNGVASDGTSDGDVVAAEPVYDVGNAADVDDDDNTNMTTEPIHDVITLDDDNIYPAPKDDDTYTQPFNDDDTYEQAIFSDNGEE